MKKKKLLIIIYLYRVNCPLSWNFFIVKIALKNPFGKGRKKLNKIFHQVQENAQSPGIHVKKEINKQKFQVK